MSEGSTSFQQVAPHTPRVVALDYVAFHLDTPGPALPPSPPSERKFLLQTSNIDTIVSNFLHNQTGVTTSYISQIDSPVDANFIGISVWESTGTTSRSLVSFIDSGSFTIGDVLDITSLVTNTTLFFSLIIFSSNNGGDADYELPCTGAIVIENGGLTSRDFNSQDEFSPYLFIELWNNMPAFFIRDMNDFTGVNIPDPFTDSATLSISAKIPTPPS